MATRNKRTLARRIAKLETRAAKDIKPQMDALTNMLDSHEKELGEIRKTFKKMEPVLKKMDDPGFINEAFQTLSKANKALNKIHVNLSAALDIIKRSEASELPTWKKGRR